MVKSKSRSRTVGWDKSQYSSMSSAGRTCVPTIADAYHKGYFPTGCENMEFNDCNALFLNDQLAVHLTNSASAVNLDLDTTGFVNFPDKDGKGYNTCFVTGFGVFDNGDEAKLRAAKAFIQYFYTNEELMNYAQIGIPASIATTERVSKYIFMKDAYSANAANTVDFTANNPNWRGVRNVFYTHIDDLLVGTKTPKEVSATIDAEWNAAIEKGWTDSKLHE